MEKSADIFETYRPELFRLAYGMLKRIAPAEDAVQEAFLRWQKQEIEKINSNRAYLAKIVSNICLDELKSAKNRREEYFGPNLPEPFLTADEETPETKIELAESLSMALLVVLEQLNPMQRAVFILHEVFDYPYASIADIVDKSEANCRKIAQRARESVQEKKPGFEKNVVEQHELVTFFIDAMQDGRQAEMENMLAKEAILYSDGGGKAAALPKPLAGAGKIAKFLISMQNKVREEVAESDRIEFVNINGEPGVMWYFDEQLHNVWSFHVENRKIQGIYAVLNPDKLENLKYEL
jgi:RNA polymerase sigma-70 factor (ECF subfamily)